MIVRADATPTINSGSTVYCALDGQNLLGVFSNEDAAKQRVSGVEAGAVQTFVIDQPSRPREADGENNPSATLPDKLELAATAAAVPVPAAPPASTTDIV